MNDPIAPPSHDPARRPVRVRTHLLVLAIAVLLPVLAFAVLVSAMLLEQDRTASERAAIERARAMMSAVDAQVRGELAKVEALTALNSLRKDDLPAFHESIANVLATQTTWRDVLLADPSGAVILDARSGGAGAFDRRSVALAPRLAGEAEVRVGDVLTREAGDAVIPISKPIVRDGAVKYVLTVMMRPESFQDVIRAQHLPAQYASGLVDTRGNFIARIPPRPAGEASSPAFRAKSAATKEGWYRGVTVDGADSFTSFTQSDLTGWRIGLAIPATLILGPTWRTAGLIAVGALCAIAAALAFAFVIGRRLVVPMASLAVAARRIGEGDTTSIVPTHGIVEIDAVAAAFQDADIAVRERQSLVKRERDALSAADRAKDEFIATLSHELRNPLAAITAAATILRRTDAHPRFAAEARDIIERQAKHMARMIEDLLDVSRILVGKANLRLEPVELGELVARVCETWRKRHDQSAHHIVVHRSGAVCVAADPTRLEQILTNLLDNARKFSPEGTPIQVRVRTEGDVGIAEVCDEGQGIAPEMLDKVFDVFVQGEQDASRSNGGLGLGLAIVKRLVELQQGSVVARSAGRGHGAAFEIRLPLSDGCPVAAPPPKSLAGEEPRSQRILVVDDNDDARRVLAVLLEFEGYEVHEATRGEDAVEMVRTARPHIALIDIGLPGIDGYETARRIRAEANGSILLVALTGYGQSEDQRRAFAAGFDAYLVKPVSLPQLKATIEIAAIE